MMQLLSGRNIPGKVGLGERHGAERQATANALRFARHRARARILRWKYRHDLSRFRCYVFFVGYPRSGHTLVAALLDAHPRMLFANGLDAAQYVQRGFNVYDLAALSIWNSLRFSRHGRRSNGFDYAVPGGSHGRWDVLDVIGDKSGDLFSARLAEDKRLMQRVLEGLAGKGRFLHVVRNPFDCISTMARRALCDLDIAVEEFLKLCAANKNARETLGGVGWKDIVLEDLIARPGPVLRDLCGFLDQEADDAYLARCASLIFPLPRRSRDSAPWTATLVEYVSARLREFEWFEGYSFEDDGMSAGRCRRGARLVAAI